MAKQKSETRNEKPRDVRIELPFAGELCAKAAERIHRSDLEHLQAQRAIDELRRRRL